MSLLRWLIVNRRARTLPPEVDDASEIHPADDEDLDYLASLLVTAKIDPELLEQVQRLLGWRIRPGRSSIRKGEFGEVVAAAIAEEAQGYLVPVKKLRYQIDPEQTLPGNDIVCVRLTDTGEVAGILFVECKLRTRADLPAGTDAHSQLLEDRDRDFADILTFVLARLYEQRSPVLPPLSRYLQDRARASQMYAISLVWEESEWDERVVDRIAALDPLLDPLLVTVARIGGLSELVDEVFERADVDLVDDESDD